MSATTAGFARTCSICGTGINEGYVDEWTSRYYCSELCLWRDFPAEDSNGPSETYLERHEDGEGDVYWTDWTDEG